jgi:curved DNA-binding protein CbpA
MGQMIRNHYQVLGVPFTAPPEAIQQAYRRIIVRAACSTGSEGLALRDELRRAREAFAVLMDPDKRAAYDRGCGRDPEQLSPQRRECGHWARPAA